MGFESDVSVREVDEDTWELAEPLNYVGNRDTFVVPKGFQTDFASVPRAFVWLLPRYGRYTKASILHDYLCVESKAGRFDRDDADGIFRRAMRELGVSFLRRWLMWAAVAAATQWVRIRSGKGPAPKRLGQVALIGVPSILFFALPFLTITVWLFLFWVAELITFLILKPFSKKPVNAPKLTWRMS
jgi:Protein of unknown function (DUF1353)